MWDELKRTDVELARQKIAELRSITLRRHEDEIKQLDADEAEIDMLARLAEAITEKYLNGRTHSDEPIDASSVPDETMNREPQQEALAPPNLEIKQNVSPNFGSPRRRLVRR